MSLVCSPKDLYCVLYRSSTGQIHSRNAGQSLTGWSSFSGKSCYFSCMDGVSLFYLAKYDVALSLTLLSFALQIPLNLLDEFNNPSKPTGDITPVLSARCVDIYSC